MPQDNSSPTINRDLESPPGQKQGTPLSISEPSLRFPRAQVNRQLANWVSSSQPEIMKTLESPEEIGPLADSAYEFVTGTDTESQDGFAPESESSADYTQNDDIHSLAGTEQTNEEDAGGDTHLQTDPELVHDPVDVDSDRASSAAESDAASDSDDSDDSDEDESAMDIEEPAFQQHDPVNLMTETARSRASALQYADEVLEKPSTITTADQESATGHCWLSDARKIFKDAWVETAGYCNTLRCQQVLSVVILSLGVTWVALFASDMLINGISIRARNPTSLSPHPPPAKTVVSVSTSTVIINHTKTIIRPEPRTTPSRGIMPPQPHLETVDGKGVCSAEVFSANEIFVKIPHSTKMSWLVKDSITIDVFRGETTINAKVSSVDGGILVEVPIADAYGILNVSVATTRKPKVNETFEVDFGKGALGNFLDVGKSIVQGFTDALSGTVEETVRILQATTSTLDAIVKDLEAQCEAAENWLENAAKDAEMTVKGYAGLAGQEAKNVWEEAKNLGAARATWASWLSRRYEGFESTCHLSLLNTQIQTNLWWLRVQNKVDEHDTYKRKAAQFMAKKVAEASRARQTREDLEKKEVRARRKQERLQARCQGQSDLARWLQQCRFLP